jgi:hypothetical protein
MKQGITIRAAAYGKGDDILLINDSPDASTELALEYVEKNQLKHWGRMEWVDGRTLVQCEDDMAAIFGMIYAAQLFARMVVAKHRNVGSLADLNSFYASGKATEEWEIISPVNKPASWN